ncbi:uncharacterized protein LOC131672447 [Phymastichus coffea]|uniref:uncharacterized protein LOC131672447 n=1 Tax=Phymastichus coffea TaxID=108790 RepID=UPI00273ABA85|nr:uncharacterized protein LOC131672447 [Phymastichus coffea]
MAREPLGGAKSLYKVSVLLSSSCSQIHAFTQSSSFFIRLTKKLFNITQNYDVISMKLILVTVALAASLQTILAADLDGIQNATPIGIPLNNPSFEFGGPSNGDAALEEGHLGGYRPLYPPYFNRNSNEQQQQYYDEEYYSRGGQTGNSPDSRLDRTLKTGAPGLSAGLALGKPSSDVQVYVVNRDSQSPGRSVVQLQTQPPSQLAVQPQLGLPAQIQPQLAQILAQYQQYAQQFSNFRTQHTHSYFYNFKFPSS